MARVRASPLVQIGVGAGSSRSADGRRCIERVQAGQRVLKDRADLLASDPTHFLIAKIVDTAAIEPDFALPQSALAAPTGR